MASEETESIVVASVSPLALSQRRGYRASPAALYLASLATPKTVKTGKESMRRICRILGQEPSDAWVNFPWESLTSQETAYVRRCLMATVSPSTVRLTLSHLRSILFEAYKAHYITHENFMRATTWPKLKAETLEVGRRLTTEEIARLCSHLAELPGAYGAMMTALCGAALGAGLRREELSRLRADALDGHTLTIQGKNQKERRVALINGMETCIQDWLIIRGSLGLRCETMFVWLRSDGVLLDRSIGSLSIARRFHQLFDAVGIVAATHDLRRTYASFLLDKGTDLLMVRTLMGHQNVETTRRYDKRGKESADKAARAQSLDGWSVSAG
jgi:site-specific recombinase XerD